MIPPSVQLTFPCPACGHHLTLRTVQASGPCPTCETTLTVSLAVTTGDQDATGGLPTPPLKFDERRFRPVFRPPSPDQEV